MGDEYNYRQNEDRITIHHGPLRHGSSMVGSREAGFLQLCRVPGSRCNAIMTDIMWLCKCECGNICEVRGSDLTTARVLSCGCFREESVRQRATKHGKSKQNRLYQTWQNMKRRCNDPNNVEYHCYGGKGVKVCDEWNNSYESFEKWAVESGYCEPLTIDRIDPNGDYSPCNCQWLTKSENSKKMHRERGHNVGTV